MEESFIELFVPGRLCIMGEHSDWAGKYRNVNNKIEKGYAIVTGIEEGIYAKVTVSDKLIVKNIITGKSFECDMDLENLKSIAEAGGYWSYVAGVAACVKEQYNISGLKIIITKTTIPEKKGLSSSAAICVLVARAFNQLYNLHLNINGEMNLAYLGEIETPSRCGRLDQACAFGKKPVLMIFDGDRIEVKTIKVQKPLYFVFADLMAGKNTIKILGELNRSFPFASTSIDNSVHEGLGIKNKEIVLKSVEYIENGDIENFGKMMIKAQENFDKEVAIACPDELKAPALHKVLDDEYIKDLSWGSKGVGSQGDGCVQILAKDAESQKKIKKYLVSKLKLKAFDLTIESTKPVKKAIIPVAGYATRMFPISKCIKKSFLPVIDNNIIKPVILCLAEELDEAGIEEICLIIDDGEQKLFEEFFNGELSKEVSAKLSSEMIEYDAHIRRIGKKIKYIVQKERLGLGHAVSLCEEFTNGEPTLLVLGDQIYKSNVAKSCTQQFLDSYAKNNKLSVSVCEVPLEDVSRYGILCGKVEDDDDYFIVDKFIEKPSQTEAEENYFTTIKSGKKYFAVFGQYILSQTVFKILRNNIDNNKRERGEFQITSAIDEAREKEGLIAFIPKGKFLDVGNVQAYKNTFKDMS